MKYGSAIRVARAARGLSQKALADLANLDASYVSMLEKNKRLPSVSTLEVIAKALDIPLHLLLLLASEKDDLRSISTEQAELLGRHLLQMVVHAHANPDGD